MRVRIIRAENLPPADPNGKSDPFVKILYDNKEIAITPRVKRNLNPKWDFVTSFPLVSGAWLSLVLEIWDRDELTANDFLGALRVPFPPWKPLVSEYKRLEAMERDVAQGRATIVTTTANAANATTERGSSCTYKYCRKVPSAQAVLTSSTSCVEASSSTSSSGGSSSGNSGSGVDLGATTNIWNSGGGSGATQEDPRNTIEEEQEDDDNDDEEAIGDDTSELAGDQPEVTPTAARNTLKKKFSSRLLPRRSHSLSSVVTSSGASTAASTATNSNVITDLYPTGQAITSPQNTTYAGAGFAQRDPRLWQDFCQTFLQPVYIWSRLIKGSLAKGRILCCLEYELDDLVKLVDLPHGTPVDQVFVPQNPRFQQLYFHYPRSWHPDYQFRQLELEAMQQGQPKDCVFPWNEQILYMVEEVTVTFHVNESNQGVLATMLLTNYRVWFVPYRRVKGLTHEDVHTISIGKIIKAFVTNKKRNNNNITKLVIENMDAGVYHVTLSPLVSRFRDTKREFALRDAESKRLRQLTNILSEIEWLRLENCFCSPVDLNHISSSSDPTESSGSSASGGGTQHERDSRHSNSDITATTKPPSSSHVSSNTGSILVSGDQDKTASSSGMARQQSDPVEVLLGTPPRSTATPMSSGKSRQLSARAESVDVAELCKELKKSEAPRTEPTGVAGGQATTGGSGSTTERRGCASSPGGLPIRPSSVDQILRRRIRYDAESEFARQGALNHPRWRQTLLNSNYQLCPSYPHFLMVPASVSDEVIIEASRFRSKNRLPVLTWLHPRTGAPLCRSSQPNTGVLRSNNVSDKELIWAIRDAAVPAESAVFLSVPKKNNLLNIVDARPEINAKSNALAGKGHESVKQYDREGVPTACLTFMGIDNIHVVRNSFAGLSQALYEIEDSNFFAAVHKSKWLEHVCSILLGASEVATHLERGEAVLVHCSDGWDRTAQLSSLAQVMLDPYFRTLEGFAMLIEKDWCSFGHLFRKRCGHPTSDQTSPIFQQFLDAVYQLTLQFPTHFQFNELFLSCIAEAVYSSWYGTFQCNSEKERREFLQQIPTVSIWDVTRASTEQFLNPLFDGGVFFTNQSHHRKGSHSHGHGHRDGHGTTPKNNGKKTPHHHGHGSGGGVGSKPTGVSNAKDQHIVTTSQNNSAPMLPVCRVRVMQLWCSQYQKAISQMRLQQREFEMLALIRQQELEISRMSSLLSQEQKAQLRILSLRSEVARLARSFNLEYPSSSPELMALLMAQHEVPSQASPPPPPATMGAFPPKGVAASLNGTPPKPMPALTSSVSNPNFVGTVQDISGSSPSSSASAVSDSNSPEKPPQSPPVNADLPASSTATPQRRKLGASGLPGSARSRSSSLKTSFLNILGHNSSPRTTALAVTTGASGTSASGGLVASSAGTIHARRKSLKHEIHLLEAQMSILQSQIGIKEYDALQTLNHFRCFNYNLQPSEAIHAKWLPGYDETLALLDNANVTAAACGLGNPNGHGSGDTLLMNGVHNDDNISGMGMANPLLNLAAVGCSPLLTTKEVIAPSSSAGFRTSQPVWERDEDAPCCKRCKKKFKTFYRNRHHCRCCGYVFCGRCTSNRMNLPEFGYYDVVRVCVVCYNQGEDK